MSRSRGGKKPPIKKNHAEGRIEPFVAFSVNQSWADDGFPCYMECTLII